MSAPKDIADFVAKFKTITDMGWIKTHRAGPTGIGKTLEDLLEITENNKDEPDFGDYELKAMRTNANSMLTLFTKAPKPPKVNALLLNDYGFATENYENGKKVLHATLDARHFSELGNTGKSLSIKCYENKIVIIDHKGNEPAFWDSYELEKAFLKKYRRRLVHVFADAANFGESYVRMRF